MSQRLYAYCSPYLAENSRTLHLEPSALPQDLELKATVFGRSDMGKETESSNQKDKKHWWEVANFWWNLTVKGILGLATFSAVIFIMLLLYDVLFHRLVVILPISVP